MGNRFLQYRIIEGKKRTVIINDNGKIVNRNPNKAELKGLKGVPREFYKIRRVGQSYTEKELKNELIRFEDEEGLPPTEIDLINNPLYPSIGTYKNHFGNWSNALKSVKLDVESMIKKGVLLTIQQRTRLAEMIVRDHFEKCPVDLAGKNKNSPCDGICPNGKNYDVKSAQLRGTSYWFNTNNKYKEEIEIYYFLAFNKDWTKLDFGWRVPGEIVEKDGFYVGSSHIKYAEFDIYNMKEYDITDKLIKIFDEYKFIK